jgi:hypothetical protein
MERRSFLSRMLSGSVLLSMDVAAAEKLYTFISAADEGTVIDHQRAGRARLLAETVMKDRCPSLVFYNRIRGNDYESVTAAVETARNCYRIIVDNSNEARGFKGDKLAFNLRPKNSILTAKLVDNGLDGRCDGALIPQGLWGHNGDVYLNKVTESFFQDMYDELTKGWLQVYGKEVV